MRKQIFSGTAINNNVLPFNTNIVRMNSGDPIYPIIVSLAMADFVKN